jgi:subtilisin-like proprotein convertase family protein
VNEDPDKPIPDGPGGTATSTVSVIETFLLRDARVFLNIEHEDVADLEVNIIHPDGSKVGLHSQGENPGDEDIRRWFEIDGTALEDIENKPVTGIWTLEVIDTIEGRTGLILSWDIELFP